MQPVFSCDTYQEPIYAANAGRPETELNRDQLGFSLSEGSCLSPSGYRGRNYRIFIGVEKGGFNALTKLGLQVDKKICRNKEIWRGCQRCQNGYGCSKIREGHSGFLK